MMSDDLGPMAAQNTDRELYREPGDWRGDFYSDSIHVTESGAIGIDCGGYVFVKPLREWHALAKQSAALLSFLDMDEAGVERLARVIRNSDLVNTLDESGGVPSWNHSVGAARWMTRECLECARTVLTELRKMASPTQRDEGE